MKKRLLGLGVVAAIAVALLRPGAFELRVSSQAYEEIEPALKTPSHRGIALFAFGDFGGLSSDTLRVSASPWKLAMAALALREVEGDVEAAARVDLAAVFRRFGFHAPETIGNWPDGVPLPALNTPLGQNTGFASKAVPPIAVTIGNMGCAACHSSVMYDADGTPDTARVWLGMPNGSINLEAYTAALFEAVRDYGGDADRLMAAVDALYPQTDWREALTLRHAILPEFQKVVAKRDADLGRLLPYRASLAGATNGLDSLKARLGLIGEDRVVENSVFNSIPDLGGRLYRRKLLNSGTYTVPGKDHLKPVAASDIDDTHRRDLASIIAYFTVPSMGVTPEVAEGSIEDAMAVTAWMQDYAPQPFPGPIDAALMADGRALYADHCAACHGTYDDSESAPVLRSFPNWEGDVGTDPARNGLVTQELADAVNGSMYGAYIEARSVESYTAPPLTGVWASAPYLHNGSVPTLWHLMRPGERPGVFEVGGHRLDMAKVGIAGVADGEGGWAPPDGYEPWSIPATVDTAGFGLGNGGHEVGFEGLSDSEKDALLEYLKLL